MNLFSRIQRLMDTSESDASLKVTATDITLTTAKGETKQIAWSDLKEVSVYATAYSTVTPCIFWHLKGGSVDIGFPDRTGGSEDALRAIHNLAGFNSLLCSHVLEGHYTEPVVVWRKSGVEK